MPIYEYIADALGCEHCQQPFEVMQKLSEAELIANPIISVAAVPAGSSDTYRPVPENYAEIDEDTQLGEWTRVTAVCHIKPNVANRVTIALWSNSAVHSVYFDDVRAMRNDTVGISAVTRSWMRSAVGWSTLPSRARKMHWRWGVTFSPCSRNSSVNSVGDFTARTLRAPSPLCNDC